jgi:Resolvase, N terminal domain
VKCARIYEVKTSGAKAERPELMRLVDNARKGDVIIVWKLYRLARSLRQLIDTTVLLNERGVELHSLNNDAERQADVPYLRRSCGLCGECNYGTSRRRSFRANPTGVARRAGSNSRSSNSPRLSVLYILFSEATPLTTD